jgi:hypothetical protein
MKSPSVPAPPDPVATANAQAQANTQAAITQQQLNMVNQVNPYGSLSYTQTGTMGHGKDATPQFTATTTLSPQEQAKQEQQWEFDKLTNQLGIDQTKKLTGLLSEPVNLNNDATESRLMELGSARLTPQLEKQRASLESRLANQGVYQGSEAYNNAMTQFGQQENDAYNQLILNGRGQSVQEALTMRNQPINEITALMSGGQVSQPNFIGTPSAQVGAPDVAGLTMDAYKYGPLAQAQMQNTNNQNMQAGLFKLGSAAAGGWAMSDARLKENIVRIGALNNGLPIYSFNFIGSTKPEVGLMAQDVEKVKPDSVMTINGYKAVNYETAVL